MLRIAVANNVGDILHVEHIATLCALAHSGVAFKLLVDDREVFNLAPTKELLGRLRELYGAQLAEQLVPLDLSRVNVSGGAIALGHPIGATGARISTTLLHEMRRSDVKTGIATLCISGGLGMAVLFER